jgi:hypothetical protein
MCALSVGCVQGSVLSPKLFGIYCSKVINIIQDSKIITYADDSYVITTAKNMEDLTAKTEHTMQLHVRFLKSIRMVVNTGKTELLHTSRKNPTRLPITINSDIITSGDSLKALGVYISKDLSWSKHVDYVLGKYANIVRRINYLSKWLNKNCYNSSPVNIIR